MRSKFKQFGAYLLFALLLIPALHVYSAGTFTLHKAATSDERVENVLAKDSWLSVMEQDMTVPLAPAQTKPAATSPVQSVPAGKKVLGYYVEYSDQDRVSYNAVANYRSMLTDVSMVAFDATADGQLKGTASSHGLDITRSGSLDLYLAVTNNGDKIFDRELVHTLLNNKQATDRLLTNLLSKTRELGATGINLDFENVPASDRTVYADFIGKLADGLHAAGKKLIVSVPAKAADTPAHSWTYGFDYARIGAKSDYVQLMTYDEHGTWSAAGPVASYPWVESVVKYSTKVIPPQKILLGIASYGYEWSSAGNRAVPYKAIPDLIKTYNGTVTWDEKSKSPKLTYVKDGVTRTLWYENDQSLKTKRGLVEAYHLGGYGVWRLGFGNQSFWNTLVK
ncbi:glycosyl hydrolase family 18 protein [Brevibacillus migulae]|uniref:glycosyl hydrolase family 18 protein n=1 Tax=Brevibacillus migulae TaxID=1644114 RepID=UPI00106EBD84|nr:glycosyl hydrolase family 18 protein [Brevibacillus migulae]